MATCSVPIASSTVVLPSTCDADTLTPEEFINCVLNAMQQFAIDMSNDAIQKANSAIAVADGADWSIARIEDKYVMEAEEPAIPEVDNTVSVYDAEVEDILPLLQDLYDQFLNSDQMVIFNPARDAAGDWLYEAIVNGYIGIPAELEEQIWGRARDRLIAQAQSSMKTVAERFAAKGWRVAPGAVTAGVIDAEISMHREIGQSSTDIAKFQADEALKTARFAVEQALKVYLDMLGAAADWIAAMIDALEQALKVAEVDPNVKANLISATASLFNARINKDSVRSGSYNNFYNRVVEDIQLKSQNEIAKVTTSVDARKMASDMMKGLGMASLTQFSGIVNTSVSG